MKRKTRLRISNMYMDVAARLPVSKAHWISGLQSQAKQRSQKHTWAPPRTVKPNNAELLILFFRFVEIFHIEDFEDLKKGLLKLFPKRAEEHWENFFESLESGGFDEASWRDIGIIYRTPPTGLGVLSTHGILPCLPEWIDHISIESTHYLPSTIAITFNVVLRDAVSEEMNRRRSIDYPDEILFRSLVPWKAWRSYSSVDSERVCRRKMTSWLNGLRIETERCILTQIQGHFGKIGQHNSPCLPALEVFGIAGTTESEFRSWDPKNQRWFDSFGFPRAWGIYGNPSLRYYPNTPKPNHAMAGRILMFWDGIASVILKDPNTSEEFHRAHCIDRIIEETKGFTLVVAMQSLLKSIQNQVESLRRNTFANEGAYKRLMTKMDQYEDVLRESMILDRFRLEFKERADLLRAEMGSVKNVMYRMSTDASESLLARTMTGIDERSRLLNDYLSQVRTAFSDLVDARNMRVNFKLQRKILWLAIIATFATIVGAVGAWPAMKELISDTFHIEIGPAKPPTPKL